MASRNTSQEATPAAAFERELTDLIASAFAGGTVVERTWDLTVPVSAAPNWTVEITRTYADDDPAYEPEFVDE